MKSFLLAVIIMSVFLLATVSCACGIDVVDKRQRVLRVYLTSLASFLLVTLCVEAFVRKTFIRRADTLPELHQIVKPPPPPPPRADHKDGDQEDYFLSSSHGDSSIVSEDSISVEEVDSLLLSDEEEGY